jgi:hypothetical protein
MTPPPETVYHLDELHWHQEMRELAAHSVRVTVGL